MRLEKIECPECSGKIIYIGNGRAYCEDCSTVYELLDDEDDSEIEIEIEENSDEYYVMEFFKNTEKNVCTINLCDFHIGENACKFDISKTAISNLKQKCNVPSNETPLMICDATIFNTGKEGFVITERGLYCHLLFEGIKHFDWHAFRKIEIGLSDDISLDIGGTVFPCNDKESELAASLLQVLQKKLIERGE